MSCVPSSATRTGLAALTLAGLLAAVPARAGDDVGSINFIMGYKNLEEGWYLGPPTATSPGRVEQPALGVELTWGRKGWPARIALDLLHSYDDGITHVPAFFTTPKYDQRLRASTIELALGLRRGWAIRSVTPYLGAGGVWVRGNAAVEIIDPDASAHGTLTARAHSRASAIGYWAGAGIAWRIGPRFQLGLSGRYSKATLDATPLVVDQGTLPFSNTTTPQLDGGGRQIKLMVGWAYPRRD